MNNTTRLYKKLRDYLEIEAQPIEYFESLYKQMSDIFDLKEVSEYKTAMTVEQYTPAQFKHLTSSIKKAFIEGYLLAQTEQMHKDIKTLYNIYRQEECPQTKKDVKIY